MHCISFRTSLKCWQSEDNSKDFCVVQFKSVFFLSSKISWCQLLFSLQVHFNFRLAFQRSSHHCDQNTISQGTLLGGGSWTAQGMNASNPQSSSLITVGSAAYFCTDFSTIEDWTMGENNFTYTFPSTSEEWSVRYVPLCRDDLMKYTKDNISLTQVTIFRLLI